MEEIRVSELDWFRQEVWDDEARSAFFAHLQRAGKSGRARYLRIQAGHLEEAGLAADALELLELLLRDYPDDRVQGDSAHYQRAGCLEALGRFKEAEDGYRTAVDMMRSGNVRTDSHIGFARHVVTHEKGDLYEEALAVLEEFGNGMLLPVQVFEFAAVKAVLLSKVGRRKEAQLLARRAIEEGARTHSGLRYHPKLGLVEGADDALLKHLHKLASG